MERVLKETWKCFTMRQTDLKQSEREGLWGEEDSRASDGELQEVNVSKCKREKSADLVSFMIEA